MELKSDQEHFSLEDAAGARYWARPEDLQLRLSQETKLVLFDVKYVGQAYGQDGSRHALDRLLKHETLQRISLMGAPAEHKLGILMLSVQPANRVMTFINPFAKEQDDGTRVKSGIDKLFNTTEAERISLFEASLIRYFNPQYNKEFKNSFPSTNLKILQDCYDKDFSAIVAEICLDALPFQLMSSVVQPKNYHIAKHDLHKDADRRAFFSL